MNEKKKNSFPSIDLSTTPIAEHPSAHIYYELILPGSSTQSHGYIHPSVVSAMPWTSDFVVSEPSERPRRVTLLDSSSGADTAAACNAALLKQVLAAKEKGCFQALGSKKINEHFRVMGVSYPPKNSPASPPSSSMVHLPRSATALFGIANRGAHMTAYTKDPETNEIKIWVPRRSAHLRTWPGRLDNSVAGGVAAQESPLECIIHEAEEEASLDRDMVMRQAVACGAVSYISLSGEGSGGEHELVCPDVLYVYDLLLPASVTLSPQDDEVEAFHLWTIPQVKEALFAGQFKTNCNMVIIDFFIRHGIITEDNEPNDYLEILSRLHRKLPVPTSPTRQGVVS